MNLISGLISTTIQLAMQAILRLSSTNKKRAKSSADTVYSLQSPNRVLYLWTLNNRTLRTSYVQQLNSSTIVSKCDSAHIERPCKFIERSSLETRMSSKGRKLIARVDTKCSRKKKDRLLDNMCMVDVKRDEYVVEKDSIIQCLQDVNDLRLIYFTC